MSTRRKELPHRPYESVAVKAARNEAALEKLRARQADVCPVVVGGQSIVRAFWGKGWNEHLESWQDYVKRLPLARTDLRHGAVLHLQIAPRLVVALVAGGSGQAYPVRIKFKALASTRWQALKAYCAGKIVSLPALLQGRLPADVLQVFSHPRHGLFPAPRELSLRCACSRHAGLCSHQAAVLCGVGVRLNEEPALFFTLRGLDARELIGAELSEPLTVEMAPAESASVMVPQDWTPRMIVTLRRRLGLTQVELGNRLGVSGAMVSFLERGSNRIKPAYLPCLRELFEQSRALSPATSAAAPPVEIPEWTAAGIRELRQRFGMNQNQFGKLLEVGGGMISYLELRGDRRIGLVYQRRLQELVEMPEGRRERLLAAAALVKPAKAKAKVKVRKKPSRKKKGKGKKRVVVSAPAVPVRNWEAAEIAALRHQLQLTQSALAQRVGVSAMTVSNWERGKAVPNAEKSAGLSALVPA